MMERIAITGAAGLIGTVLCQRLGERYELRTLDSSRRSGLLHRREDTRRLALTQAAFSGCQTVIDLAANGSSETGWREITEGNLPATLGSFEGARRAGVRRVILASSNHVTGLYERDEPYASICAGHYEGLEPAAIPKISSEFPIRPDGPYAVGKAAGEAAGRWYAEEHGLSVICLRIGTVYRDDRPKSQRGFATLLTHDDLLRLIGACIDAPLDVGFGVLYGVSANTWRYWDIEEGRRLVGYEALDDAEQWRQA